MTNKLKFIIYFFLLSTFGSFAQKQIIIYTNENYETIEDKNVAKYYRILTFNKDNKSGLQKIYSIGGTLKFSGKYLSAIFTKHAYSSGCLLLKADNWGPLIRGSLRLIT